ncbi:exodeoxyribonuclease V subunit gamma [Arenimonas oryziterrae]|uniref:RecBCD enzyme subunit RecC n=1 Tax=Arenimonas oryziterrae DSM 21050 = YC6267 TaxID=1121015 RepID=A0A091AXA9_9GAMM|nr:exodeoxyribonuclease V subunit gamma [Arenimonas oryziterrae]KFN43912.1 hypothetical protein N789_08160 [Arenimonas oryziterrae DSM 21050 = YC6267]
MPSAPSDFRLYHGNDLDVLAGILAAELARPVPGRALLDPDTIVIPQPAMRRWLQKTLAERHGIAANLEFLTPGELVARALDANLPQTDDLAVADAATLRWRLWAVLDDASAMAAPVFAPLRAVLAGGDRRLTAWTLAGELAGVFEKYQAWRRAWLMRWDAGADRDDWQAELWRRATRGLGHRAARLQAYLARFGDEDSPAPAGLPPRVFAFACQNVSPDVLRVIASTARAGSLHFFFVSPVAGWWGDLRGARERLRDDADAVFADRENPLLRANGAASRDFVQLLFSYEAAHPSWEQAIYVPPDASDRPGLLHELQRDLLARRPTPTRRGDVQRPVFDPLAAGQRSLQFHNCHTRLREVQVLHDQLRALLDADPGLQPRDIAVLTPDIDAYAPAIAAVFGGAEGTLAIPYAIGDRSVLATQALAEAFATLLALPDARFTATEILEWLAVPAIAQRFGLDGADFDRLRDWLHAAGARWGLNAAHRLALDAPEDAAYTWAWAIDRLLLGHAVGEADTVAGVAPLPVLEGGAVATLDSLLQGLRAFARWQRQLQGDHRAGDWQTRLSQMLLDIFPERPAAPADQRTLEWLRGLISTFAAQVQAAQLDAPIPAPVMRAWFQSALAADDTRQPWLSGGVTFGKMVPMRLIPFRVICLLGMNDGEFPRRDPAGSLNRLAAVLGTAQRQHGDRSIRDDDRSLFLQLFAAAGDVFYVSYLGQDPRSGEALPPSVVVAELADAASEYFADAANARRELIVDHPLQPFSPAAFGQGDARRLSYRANWRPSVDATTATLTDLPAFAAPLPALAATTTELTRDDIVRTLKHPPRAYLRQGLGLRLDASEEALPDAEPLGEDDGRRTQALAQRVFTELARDAAPDADRLRARLLAEGRLAPGADGEVELKQILAELAPAAAAWRGWAQGPGRVRTYALDLGDTILRGELADIHDTGLLQFSASRAQGHSLLGLQFDALVWAALGETRPIHRMMRGGEPEELSPVPAAAAIAGLRALVALHRLAQTQVLPFMPRTAHVLYEAARAGRDGWSQAKEQWLSRQGYGEGESDAVRLALRGRDPFDDALDDPSGAAAEAFRRAALEVFAALAGDPGAPP